jgi:endonuclease/exonuclease/phosphatase family metal-dependent hydrolase
MPELTVASFNIHYGVVPHRISMPRPRFGNRRPHGGEFAALEAICSLNADVIVLQETHRPDTGPSLVDAAAARLGYDSHEVVFGRGVLAPWPHVGRHGTSDVGLAVLTRLPARGRVELPARPVLLDPAPTRLALHLVLELEGTPVDLVGVHLTSRLPHGPPLQLRRLAAQLGALGRERPAIVAGDMNFWGPPVVALMPGWRRAVRGRTWPAHRPHSQIDHVLVRGDVEVVEATVFGPVGSDHRPVRARLRVG